jgi:hypothetical protein
MHRDRMPRCRIYEAAQLEWVGLSAPQLLVHYI